MSEDDEAAALAHEQELEARRQGIVPKQRNPWEEFDQLMDEGMPYYVKVREKINGR